MAGTITADFIRSDANKLSLQVGNTVFASINAMGLMSNTGNVWVSQTGAITANNISVGRIVTPSVMPTGSVLQVVSATYSTQTSTSSTSYTDTGLSASITPSSASNKILVIVSQNGLDVTATSAGIGLSLVRGSTNLLDFAVYASYSTTGVRIAYPFNYLDSPSTTSSTTYKTQYKKMGGTGNVVVQDSSSVSAITLMEIAV